jgi:26S proteasome regulatory subunit N12
MATTVDQILPVFEEFRKACKAKPCNTDLCKSLLTKLKVGITGFQSFPLGQASNSSQKELLLAREMFELACLLAVEDDDPNSFERHFAQVKPFYFDFTQHKLPESERQFPLLGLNLLCLLAHNRIAEFHTELELLAVELHSNLYIKFPILMEQYLMEGNYAKIVSARNDVPAEWYLYFMDILTTTVRDEIADCSEKTYGSLPLDYTTKLLTFSNQSELQSYIDERNADEDAKYQWRIEKDRVHFNLAQQSTQQIPSMRLIQQTLTYAKELERIV